MEAADFPGGSAVRNLSAMQEKWDMGVRFLGWEDSLEKSTQPTPVFFPENSHGPRSLASYRPWGRKESDTTEATEQARMGGADRFP